MSDYALEEGIYGAINRDCGALNIITSRAKGVAIEAGGRATAPAHLNIAAAELATGVEQ